MRLISIVDLFFAVRILKWCFQVCLVATVSTSGGSRRKLPQKGEEVLENGVEIGFTPSPWDLDGKERKTWTDSSLSKRCFFLDTPESHLHKDRECTKWCDRK
jgi:hypothetical protein